MFLDYRFAGCVGSYGSGVTQGQYPDGYGGTGGGGGLTFSRSRLTSMEMMGTMRGGRWWDGGGRGMMMTADDTSRQGPALPPGHCASTTTHADSLLVNATCWRRYGLGIRKYWVRTIRTEKSNFEKQLVRCCQGRTLSGGEGFKTEKKTYFYKTSKNTSKLC